MTETKTMGSVERVLSDNRHCSPIIIAAALMEELRLEPGVDCDMRISRYSTSVHIEVTLEMKQVSAEVLRNLKREVQLEVPSFYLQGGWSSPPINGKVELKLDDRDFGPSLVFDLTVGGAYECREVGVEEREPTQASLLEAERLETMTPEEALAKLKMQAAQLRLPITSKRYSCTPVKPIAND